MFDFEKISIKQLSQISKVLCESKLRNTKFLKRKYIKGAINYEGAVFFLKALNLIKEKDGIINPMEAYKDFLVKYRSSSYDIEVLIEYFIKILILKDNAFSKYIDQFLSNFIFISGQYIFRATTTQRLKYSGIRNFLLELKLINIYDSNIYYYVLEKYSAMISKFKDMQKLSLSKLESIMKRRAQIGYKAELEVIRYETSKLKAFPALIKKIEHTSILDATAGYDISSYRDELGVNKQPMPIYIEVKAVPSFSYEFYWTKNEIGKAKKLGKDYLLYLLPVVANNLFELKNMLILADPFKKVFLNKNKWGLSPESYFVKMK